MPKIYILRFNEDVGEMLRELIRNNLLHYYTGFVDGMLYIMKRPNSFVTDDSIKEEVRPYGKLTEVDLI